MEAKSQDKTETEAERREAERQIPESERMANKNIQPETICDKIDDPDFEFDEWSEELVKELRHRFRNGASTEKLAQKTGMFEFGIRKKLGLKPKEENIELRED